MKYINTKKRVSIFLYLIIFSFVFGNVAMGSEEISIIVKQTSKVNSEDVYLKDIAEIKAPSFLQEEIGEIIVAEAPDPGEIKIILKDRLFSKIYSNHLVDKNAKVNVPEKIYIKRQTQKIEQDYLKESFLKYVGTFHEGGQFDLRDFSVRGIEPYPEGELTLLFDRNNRFSGKGRFSIRVDIMVDNINIDTISISGWVDVYEQFVCARMPLKKNQPIETENLYYKKINTSKLRHQYARSIEEVVGQLPNRHINKGDLIKTDSLKQAPLIHKGKAIKLVAKRDGLKIITAGISKEDGIADSLIRVENLASGKVVRGFVKGDSTVEVYY